MANQSKTIYVFTDWLKRNDEPILIGTISCKSGKGKQLFSFSYDKDFLKTQQEFILDPEIHWYAGEQYPLGKNIFGVFNDTMPDTWGRTLMKRRESIKSLPNSSFLTDLDFLLGVNDVGRMGGLRFKSNINGPFLDDDNSFPTPPWTSIRELQSGIKLLESDKDNADVIKWIEILLAPGSSLGGARPKANIVDELGNLWIAKFPSKLDSINKGAWEFLAYNLAIKAGIPMAESKAEIILGKHHTFFTKRFDRDNNKRIHFVSAMTMTGNNEFILKDKQASYLDIAEFIQFNLQNSKSILHQLWRRIVFNILISNTDDHLRNHGFLLINNQWNLSPAFDINPSIDKNGLDLNIDATNNTLDIELAKSVGAYFQLQLNEMNIIIEELTKTVATWEDEAKAIGISRAEISMMRPAFKV
jgi:serine/threonine-protein kinase HipA